MIHVPYDPEHLKRITPRADMRANAARPEVAAALARLGPDGLAVTLTTPDGNIVSIAGGVEVAPGVLEVFILASDTQKAHAISFARKVRQLLTSAELSGKYRRVQALGAPGDAVICRWLKWLGFHFEGRLTAYGPDGADLDMWAKVRTT